MADRRAPRRASPPHSTASLTSPRSETSSTSSSGGSASWSSPGAVLTPRERRPGSQDSTRSSPGTAERGSSTRRPPERRAGSTKTSARPGNTSRVTSARTRETARPSSSALAAASSSLASSRSTPVAGPRAARASRSPPTEQQRSRTWAPSAYRLVRWTATRWEEDCSSASAVHHSRSPAGCLASARRRSTACSRANGPSSGPSGRTASAARSRSAGASSRVAANATAARPSSDSSRRAWADVRPVLSGATWPGWPSARRASCRTTPARRWCCGCSTGRRWAPPRRCRWARRARRDPPWA